MFGSSAIEPVAFEPVTAERDFSSTAATKVQEGKDGAVVKSGKVQDVKDVVSLHFGERIEEKGSESDSKKSSEVKDDQSGVIDEEHAREISEALEKAINDIHGTQVKFSVSAAKDDRNVFYFQVVKTETGEVVRQFPPEETTNVIEKAKTAQQSGLLVDYSV